MSCDIASSCLIRGNNSVLDGYIPIVRECQGITLLMSGIYNLASARLAPVANDRLWRLGQNQLVYGVINLVYSPITVTVVVVAIGCFGHKRTD